MTNHDDADFFMDLALVDDPYPYLDGLRAQGPAVALPAHNVLAVTGFEEAAAVHLDTETFSAVNAVTGPLPPLPFAPEGADITGQIEAHRARMPFGEELLTLDPPRHTPLRSLTMRLFTPRRLKEMEPAIAGIADRLIDEFEGEGACELVRDFATPFSTLVIAELLGVPEEDRAEFRARLGPPASQVGSAGAQPIVSPLEFRRDKFLGYVAERRRRPRRDILSDLANAEYPDGSTPPAEDVVRVASLLFGAGQDTTAHLLGNAMRLIAEDPALQTALRYDAAAMPGFIEEVLRHSGPVKATFRLARKATEIAGVPVPAGTHVMIATAAANRDPRRFEAPGEFRPGRPGAKEHLSFGRGAHTCPGAALARAEARIALDRLLARLAPIAVDESRHGGPGERRFAYAPTYIFRALKELHLRFEAATE